MASCSQAASKAVSKARLFARHKYQRMRVIERESGERACVCVEMETKKAGQRERLTSGVCEGGGAGEVRRGNPPVEASMATCLGVDMVSREPGSTEKKRWDAPARAANGGFANPTARMLLAADTDRIAGASRGRTACCRTRAVSVSAPPDVPRRSSTHT